MQLFVYQVLFILTRVNYDHVFVTWLSHTDVALRTPALHKHKAD